MTTERFDIVVREDGARVVKRNLEDIGKVGDKSAAGVNTLKRALGGLAAFMSVRKIIQYADTYTNLQNRLKQVTNGTANLAGVTSHLFDVANRTRSSFEGTAELYSRVALATKEYGLQQSELLTFTEKVNQAIILSGASAAEASAGLIQFSQGLASGALRGDELRSVLEQLPAVADVIAKSMGKTRGELRKMGEQGLITTSVILKAFREAEGLGDAFAKTVPTVGQAFQVLENQFIRFIGELDKATGASETFARFIISIATNMKGFVAGVTSVSVALALLAGPRVIGAAITGFNLLTAAMMRNPFGLAAVAIAGVVSWLIQMESSYDDVLKSLGKTASVMDRVRAVWAGSVAYIKAAWEDLPSWFEHIGKSASNALMTTLEKGLNWLGQAVTKLTGHGGHKLDVSEHLFDTEGSGRKAAGAFWEAYQSALVSLADETGTLGASGTGGGPPVVVDEKAAKKAARILQQLKGDYASLVDAIDPVQGAVARLTEAQVLLDRARTAGLVSAEQESIYLERVAEYYQDALDPIGKINRELEEQERLLTLTSTQREVETQYLSIRKELLDQNIKLTEEETESLRDQLTALQQLNEAARARDQLLSAADDRKGFTAQVNAASELSASGVGGFSKGDAAGFAAGSLSNMGIDTTHFQTQLDAQYAMLQTYYGQVKELRDAGLISEQEYANASMQIEMARQNVFLNQAGSFFSQMAVMQKSNSSKLAAVGKAAAISGAIIDTYKAATGAYASLAAIPYYGPVLGAAAAGAAIAAGMANVAAIRAQQTGFQEGGYTGNMGRSAIAGVVHGQEFVANADATRRNRPVLEAMNRGQDVGGSTQLSVQIVNQIPGAEFEVNKTDDNRIEIIARRVVREESDGTVAMNLRDPNSKTSKSLAQNTKVVRNF